MTAPITLLFVGGLGRSGSTLLDRLLGAVDGYFAFGELVHLWQRGLVDNERCGCGVPFDECPVWTRVGQVAFGGWDAVDAQEMLSLQHAVDRHRHVPQLLLRGGDGSAWAAELTTYTSVLSRLYSAVQEVTGARVLVDSTKHPSTAFLLRHVESVDVRLVHLVRDSRGIAHSWSRTVRRPESTNGESYMTRWPPQRIAAQYMSYNPLLHGLAHRVPSVLVRYEDVVASPETQLRRILALTGDADTPLPFLDGSTARLEDNHNVGGNPMRFRRGEITLDEDDEWRTEMNPTHRRMVTTLTAPLLVRYGYTPRREVRA